MTIKNRWLLPAGIQEVLPPQAMQLELLCRQVMDLYTSWGYELVMPPLVEYLDSLLTGTSADLDLQTFKLTDQLNGKMMGVRADSTPQVARIDAHKLKRTTPARLYYLGTTLHTRPAEQGGTRAPLQAGAELYGHAGKESDVESISLMLKTMELVDVKNVHVDMGHVGVYGGLVEQMDIRPEQEAVLFDTLQRKARAELESEISAWSVPGGLADMLMSLLQLNGGMETLSQSRQALAKAGAEVNASIDDLEKIAEAVLEQVKNAPLFFDLAELSGYHYYTGMTFTAYVPGRGQGIAFGGRYDDIGRAFGRPRPATGFSTDIKTLFSLTTRPLKTRAGIFAPCSTVPGLPEAIDSLRKEGEIVIRQLSGQAGGAEEMNCDRELVLIAGQWKTKKI